MTTRPRRVRRCWCSTPKHPRAPKRARHWRAPRATSRCCCSPRVRPGAPKPAMLTHGSLLANLEQMQAHPGLRVDDDDVAFGVLPFFHVFGLNVVLGLALHGGRGGVARRPLPSGRDARPRAHATRSRSSRRCRRCTPRGCALADDVAPADAFASRAACASRARPRYADGRGRDARALRRRRCTRATGSPKRRPSSRRPRSSTEPRAVRSGRRSRASRCGSSTPTGTTCSTGDPGEILVRGPNVFAGYWDDRRRDRARARRRLAAHRRRRRRRRRRLAQPRRPGQGRHHRLGVQRVSRRGRRRARAVTPASQTSRSSANRIRAPARPLSRSSSREPGADPGSGRAAAARGPPHRALQAADARRGRRRVAALVRGQVAAPRADVERHAPWARALDATTNPA